IQPITAVGAEGTGRVIAYVEALSRFSATLVDIFNHQLDAAVNDSKQNVEKRVGRGKLSSESREDLLAHLQTTEDLSAAVRNADFVIEAVPENRSFKQSVMKEAEVFAPEHAIFTSNTSTISPTELASYTKRPHQFAVMHFFNPVHLMRLVEIVRGLE